jgi:CII-binding regulator of phage lambda lysogenization HflD
VTAPETGCQVCNLYSSGHTEQGALTEAIRHRRLLLAAMTESADTVIEIRNEIGDCLRCALSLARSYLVINAGMVIAAFGGDKELAIAGAQQALLDYLDEIEHPKA